MKRAALGLISVLTVIMLLSAAAGCAQPSAPAEQAKPTAEQPKPAATPNAAGQEKAATPAAKTGEATKPKDETANPKSLEVVRVALQGSASDSAAFIAYAKGYFKEQGIDFQHAQVSAPTDMVPLLASGQVDVAGVLTNAAFLNGIGRGIKMKGVADKGRLTKGNGYEALMVRKDLVDSGKYKSPSDLKGWKVGLTPPPLSGPNAYNLYVLLKQVGLTMNDVDLVGIALPDMPAALAGGSLDAAVVNEPYVSKAVEIGVAKRVLGFEEVTPDHQVSGICFSEAFMRDKPEVAKRFVVAYLKGARDYNDAFVKNKGKEELIKVLTQATTVKDASIWEKTVSPGINPNGYLNAESVVEQVDWLNSIGVVNTKLKAEDIIDNQYVDYALSVLGKYE